MDGLSPGFLIAWIFGDASNLLGCFLTGQLGVQTLLASYYCCVDIILVVQYILYRPKLEVIDAFDPEISGDYYNSTDNSTRQRKPRTKSALERAYHKLGVIMGLSALANPTAAAPLEITATSTASWSKDVGLLVAYFSMVMYLMSRAPQILHNFQRKSTTGISIILFICALMGNLTYTLSILFAPESMGEGADRRAFLLNELPYILGASGTMLFDCVILGQWYWYQKHTHHRRRSTQILDLISRPYLGVSRSENSPRLSETSWLASTSRPYSVYSESALEDSH
nr:SpYpq2.1 [Starmerella bombicola]